MSVVEKSSSRNPVGMPTKQKQQKIDAYMKKKTASSKSDGSICTDVRETSTDTKSKRSPEEHVKQSHSLHQSQHPRRSLSTGQR